MTVPESTQGDPVLGRPHPADGLPPLPTLAPLPVIKPMSPMPRPPWEAEGDAAQYRAPIYDAPAGRSVPPPTGHPAADEFMTGPQAAALAADDWRAAAYAPPETYSRQELSIPPLQTSPSRPHPAVESVSARHIPGHEASSSAPEPQPTAVPEPTEFVAPAAAPISSAPSEPPAADGPSAASYVPVANAGQGYPQPRGRHGAVERPAPPVAAAAGRHVLIIGGGEPLGSMIAQRLIAAGHLLALAEVAVPSDITPQHDRDGRPVVTAEPTILACDRFDTDDVVRTVARAEVALGGLDALVILPAAKHSTVRLDADAATWADEWSTALTAEVLAAACASHIAARSFLARRRAGRIILITDGRDIDGAQPGSAVRAALSRLGTDLSRELAPHGVGVSVVTEGGTGDFGLGQVADVVEALLATPVMSTVGAHIG